MKRISRVVVMLLLAMTLALSFAACDNNNNAVTPHIGDNGNWFIGDTDTGVKARGEQGENGDKGEQGDGGLSAYEIYISYYPDYTGTEKEWIDDLANGNLARFTVTFDSTGGSEVEPLSARKGTGLEKPLPTKNSHEFGGWYIDEKLSTPWDFENDVVTGHMTLYAKWIPIPTEGLEFWAIRGDTEYAVGEMGSADGGHIVIPSTYNGLPVTTIAKMAFFYCDDILSITIPDSVTEIDDNAFAYCVSLTEMAIPSGVATINYGTFAYCVSLRSVTIPDSVTTIESNAFRSCMSLTNVIIPEGVTVIADHAFAECDSLANVTIPDSVTTIEYNAFRRCFSLDNITIPDGVTTIGNYAFAECGLLSHITVPDSVATMGGYVFADCTALTSIHIKGYTQAPDSWDDGWKNDCNATVEWNCQH